jgi:hypothetical protein
MKNLKRLWTGRDKTPAAATPSIYDPTTGQASSLSPEQQAALAQLALEANTKLETSAQEGANHAFNLGCSVGILPGAIIVLLAFILGRSNLLGAIIAALLVVLALVGFANYAAFQAKHNTLQRTYQRDIAPEIERTLNRLELSHQDFNHAAGAALPENAALRSFLLLPPNEEG